MTMRPALPLRLMLALRRWWRDDVLELAKEWRWSFLPPLMIYMAAGISGLTGIAGTFFVKEYLDLSAAFLAALGFWAGIPWALKMPLGHLVDLFWRRKALFVWLGAALIAASLLIMIGLTTDREAMAALWPVSYWYVLSTLLAPLGYVLQDVVADAMTVEAVPTRDERGEPLPEAQIKLMHTTLQTLGRIAILGGGVLVSLANVLVFSGTEQLTAAQKAPLYARVYALALVIHKLTGWKLSRAYLFTDLTVLLASLSYIPVRRIAFSLVTVTVSSLLIDWVKEYTPKNGKTNV